MCPGTTEYQIGSPLFDRVTISLPGGKKFVVTTKQNGPQRPYIRWATLNHKEFHRSYLTHDQIAAGGELVFDMTSLRRNGRPPPRAVPSALKKLFVKP